MPWYAEKIGPLPAGVWVGVIVAGVGGGLLWQRRQAGATPQVATGGDTGTGTTQAPLQDTGGGGLVPANVTVLPPGPVTNEEWIAVATTALAAAGHPADVVEAALTKYVSGQSLTPAETVYKNLAIAAIGFPPLAIPQGPSTPAPPPQPPAPTGLHIQKRTRAYVWLIWNPVPGATGYGLYRDGNWSQAITFPLVPSAVVGNATHRYAVKAHYRTGKYSGISNVLQVNKA